MLKIEMCASGAKQTVDIQKVCCIHYCVHFFMLDRHCKLQLILATSSTTKKRKEFASLRPPLP
eukprot:m.150941 g.150941  ORF g.150941 m.150941 type:complete len:63 (+) comp38558_c2_seq3:82-270(+)